jgi:hypothetical protein
MNSLETAYFNGFIKAANKLNTIKDLSKLVVPEEKLAVPGAAKIPDELERMLGEGNIQPEMSKHVTDSMPPKWLENFKGGVPESAAAPAQSMTDLLKARGQAAALTTGNEAERVAAMDRLPKPSNPKIQLKGPSAVIPHPKYFGKSPQELEWMNNPERGMIPHPVFGNHALPEQKQSWLKRLFNIGEDNKMNMTPDQLGKMPIGQAALLGSGAGIMAGDIGSIAGDVSGIPSESIELKDPMQAALSRTQQVPGPVSSLYEKLMNHISNNKTAYGIGAGAAGLGGLGYYLHNKNKNKNNESPTQINSPASLE